MENLQGLPYSRKDGPTVQFWPAHEQTGHGLSNLYQDTPQVYLERRPSSSVADQSASATHDLPSSMNSLGQLEDSNRGVNWANAWTWDSFSLTAQLATNGTDLHKGSHARVAPQSQLDSPSPDKSEMNGEPILLEFGLNTMGKKGNDEDGLLDLKLGANGHYWEADEVSPNSKRSRHSPPDSQQTRCQVDTCTADLQNAKDYHRRHKVCESHAKAPKALVGRVMQRFCQQCSRFHLLKEFDDDRRSCRKRLAGHNRRRRKAQPDPAAALASLLADQSILSRIIGPAGQHQGKDSLEKLLQEHALIQTLLNARVAGGNAADNKSQATDASVQSSLLNLVAKSQLLGNLLLPNSTLGCELPPAPAPVPAPADALITALSNALLSSLPQLLQKSNGDVGLGGSIAVQGTGQIQEPHVGLLNADAVVKQRVQSKFSSGEQPAALLPTTPPVYSDKSNDSNGDIGDERLYSGGRHLTNGNKRYTEGSGMRSAGNLQPRGAENREPIGVRSDTSTPPMGDQPERSAGGSDHSLDSGFDKQVQQGKDQTYQLWFKIFDKGPADFPHSLRDQMLDWLNHLPDLEGHIRPGCVILSVFVCMPGDAWDKLCSDIKKSLEKLVSISDCDFWRRGRVLVDLGQNSALIMDGKVYTNTRPKSMVAPNLILVQPFSVVVGETVDLTLRGQNLRARGTKAICSYDGKCADKELALPTQSPEKKRSRDEASRLAVGTYVVQEEEAITCTIGPFDTMGRGFIEVEGQSCNGNAFPIVIADRPICEELSCLEREYVERIESKTIPYLEEAADITHFLHELGWILQRVKWKARNVDLNLHDFAPARYRWLLRFSVEHGCRAVVRRVLDILFSTGHKPPGSIDTIAMDVLSEANLLHVAVKSNSPPMVEFLLTYAAPNGVATSSSKQDFLFRPDAPISDGLTCLHIAASMHAAEDVIDALTDAPDEHWAVAWATSKDSFGKTPLMHALASGNYGYVKMVQSKLQKIGRWSSRDDVEKPLHLALSIDANDAKSLVSSFPRKVPLAKQIGHCTCRGRELLLTRNLPLRVRSLNMYRPFMLMMLAVAAVCVCVGVLMKGPPHVSFLHGPFVWEAIGFGTM